MTITQIVVCLMILLAPTTATFKVNVVVFGENGVSSLPFSYQKSLPAVNMAQEAVADLYRDHIEFNFIYNITQCTGDGTGALAADLHCLHDIGVIIGPACPTSLDAVSHLVKFWNIPLITPAGSGITNKTLYPTVTSINPYATINFANGLNSIMKYFKWKTIAIMLDEEYTIGVLLKDEFLLRFGYNYTHEDNTFTFKASDYTNETLQKLWQQAQASARIFVIFCRLPEIKALMIAAYNLGYVTSGQFVFFIQENLSKYPSPVFQLSLSYEDQIFLQSLGQALWPYVDKWTQENVNFTTEVIRRSLLDYGYDYQDTKVSPYVSCYYDAITIYATLLNETLYEGGDPMDGKAMTLKMKNRIFQGVHVPVKLNDEGYRESDLTFAYYNVSSGVLTPALIWHYASETIDVISDGGTLTWPYNKGVPPPDVPECGFSNEKCVASVLSSTVTGFVAGALGFLTLIGVLIAAFLFRAWRKQYDRNLWWWKIHPRELSVAISSAASSIYSKASLKSLTGSALTDMSAEIDTNRKYAVWKGQVVRLRPLNLKYAHVSKQILNEFKILRELSHANLVQIHGACLEDNFKMIVTEPCFKGTLEDILGNSSLILDTHFKFSLSTDVINGLCYIHESPIRHHGRLRSEVCLIDNRFSLKLCDFGLPSLFNECQVDITSQEYKHECMWKAPEVLRAGTSSTGSKEADIYSFAIIMQEILTKDAPYSVESVYLTTDEIISKVMEKRDPPFRPTIELPASMGSMKNLIEDCWREDPRLRLNSRSVKMRIRQIATSMGETGHLLDNLMRRMEMYANSLEKMVEEKARELWEEKKKSEALLDQILPRSVADCLKSGHRVEPQAYECVTIYFSDIVGFTVISGKSSPLEVVDLLNDLYSCFDSTIEAYDVYKVETIGDAYMVVSGLPQRNGDLHVVNIANMAINVLDAIREFKIKHLPDEKLKIRIGLHSGPVCAGVVGVKMPRYCLFGDTVNTASRMESHGKAMMIHVSHSCKLLLDQFGHFHTKPRGRITIKGKGDMFTYWLVSTDSTDTNMLVNSEED